MRDGSFAVDGTIDDVPARFLVDTGSTVTAVAIATLEAAGLQPVDIEPLRLATGAHAAALIFIVPQLCVGPFCVADLRVVGVPAPSGLLGTDFLAAAGLNVTIASGVMTLATNP
jgi:aspartyl protease family protein